MAYQETPDRGGHWVFNKRVIAVHYAKGWLLIDVVSVVVIDHVSGEVITVISNGVLLI